MRILLDTNVISELRRNDGNTGVGSWLALHDSFGLAINVVEVHCPVARVRVAFTYIEATTHRATR